MSSFGDLNRVNTNIQSMDSQLSLNRINRGMADNQLKMSTGLRINRAEDDAAGYSIATKLNSRVTGLTQAMSNVGDAKSVLDIAEASFTTIMDSLIEMKGMATQAANDTLGATERGYIGEQIAAMGRNINEMATQTVFQDYNLLNGSVTGGVSNHTGGLTMTFQVGERASDTISTTIKAVNVAQLFSDGDTSGTANIVGVNKDGVAATVGNIAIKTGSGIAAQGDFDFGTGVNAATSEDFRVFMGAIDSAIVKMSERVNAIGITQSSLSIREVTLSQSISANSSAVSRIMDTDFAKAQSESVRFQILQQTATSALAQANNGPQSVLGFLK
jgi:flagellin